LRARIIPILGIKDGKLVKTVKYNKSKYIGDPINAIKIFNDKEVDELAIIDIRATINSSEPNYGHLADMASEAFMPMSYGGGIDSFDKARRVFDCGIEKIIINTSFYSNFQLIDEVASTYGSQSVVISVDVNKNWLSKEFTTTHSGTRKSKRTLEETIEMINRSNAGEVLLNDISRDGTFEGFNLSLIQRVSSRLSLPLVANCGGRDLEDIRQALSAGASAVAASSMFIFRNQNPNSILINYKNLS
jgi:imidazole glycerol-phosphate synthase subunit HisF